MPLICAVMLIVKAMKVKVKPAEIAVELGKTDVCPIMHQESGARRNAPHFISGILTFLVHPLRSVVQRSCPPFARSKHI